MAKIYTRVGVDLQSSRRVLDIKIVIDTGVGANVLPLRAVDELEKQKVYVPTFAQTRDTRAGVCYGSRKYKEAATRSCRLNIELKTQVGRVRVRFLL